jgi:transcriptional regulator CtsR
MSEYYKMVLSDNEHKILLEIEMQEIASKYGFSPKIINSKITHNKEDGKYITGGY